MSDSKTQLNNVVMFARENQSRRLFLLHELYNWGNGHPCEVAIEFLSNSPLWEEFDILDIAAYLEEEGLLVVGVDQDPRGGPIPNLRLTHKGILEVEKSIAHPTEGTKHFPASIIQQYFQGPVGTVQTGRASTATVTQNTGSDAKEVLFLISQLRKNLEKAPVHEQREALEIVDALSEEVTAPNPRTGRVKAYLTQLSTVAIKVGSETLLSTIAKYLTGAV